VHAYPSSSFSPCARASAQRASSPPQLPSLPPVLSPPPPPPPPSRPFCYTVRYPGLNLHISVSMLLPCFTSRIFSATHSGSHFTIARCRRFSRDESCRDRRWFQIFAFAKSRFADVNRRKIVRRRHFPRSSSSTEGHSEIRRDYVVLGC
jgi:hypothetical protein